MDIRYAVRVFAFKDNKVACIKYKNINKDYFDIPGGKIEDGETEIQTCIREFKEETGMDINDLKCIGNVEIIYPGKNKKFVMKTYFIFYFNAEVEKGNSHFCKILTTTPKLGIEMAKTISSFVSDITNHDTFRQVMLHDINSINTIPDISFSVQEDGTFIIKEAKLPYILLQDDKFLVAVLNRERYVEVFLYQKNNMIAVA